MTDEAPPSVLAAWEAVVGAWDQPAKHDAFAAAVSQAEAFAWAAKRYKERSDDAIAVERLAKLQKAAVFKLMGTAGPRPEPKSPYRMIIILFFAFVVVTILGLIVMDSMPKHGPDPASSTQMR